VIQRIPSDVIPRNFTSSREQYQAEPQQPALPHAALQRWYNLNHARRILAIYEQLLTTMQDLILKPVRVATSKPAQQTYLNTILFMTTSAILLGFAVFAYILFYFNYVPQIGIERIIHLQYGYGDLSCL
jgi:Putative adipose-regulatory protein (Seipin)